MTNKYFIIGLVVIIILALGLGYRLWFLPEANAPLDTGVIRHLTVVAEKDEWRFTPELIEVNQGDTVVLTAINEDSYDHGLAIDAFGVSQRMPANSTITVQFVVTQAGEFPFYCSVPCGEGEVTEDGQTVHRTHFDMIGRLRVLDAREPGE